MKRQARENVARLIHDDVRMRRKYGVSSETGLAEDPGTGGAPSPSASQLRQPVASCTFTDLPESWEDILEDPSAILLVRRRGPYFTAGIYTPFYTSLEVPIELRFSDLLRFGGGSIITVGPSSSATNPSEEPKDT